MNSYNWTRYWYSFKEDTFDSEKIFLDEYDIKYKRCLTLDAFEETPCLILLGEPGVGKSYELRKEFERIKSKIAADTNLVNHVAPAEDIQLKKDVDTKFLNLGSIEDVADLHKELFDSEIYVKWLAGDYNLYLFWDSLDEALMQIKTLTTKLAEKLKELPVLVRQRLYLRITCRPAEWNHLGEFQRVLVSIWNEPYYRELRLAPLSALDVRHAASSGDIDSDKFMEEIYNKQAAYFASDPTTLQMLINEFKENSTLPSNQSDIFERGCLIYCEETSGRIEAGRARGLTKEEKFRIASRIASLIIFANKESVWNTIDTGEHSERDILVSTIEGYYPEKKIDQSDLEVTQEAIEITLDTRLFIKTVGKRLKWKTRRLAEYLASWYLDYRRISDELVIEILGGKYLPPQLYEVAALVASKRENVFRHLITSSPLVLLRSNLLLTDEKLREQLIEELLKTFKREEARDSDFRPYYTKLKHPNLAKQLAPFLGKQNKGSLVQKVAIDIAEECNLVELQDGLARVALDKQFDRGTRINAAYAVTKIGDRKTRKKLLALIEETEDKYLELKGRGLAANWNENLTAEELFRVLETPPANFYGSYQLFFYRFLEKLEENHLPIALNWLRDKIATEGESIQLERISDEILLMAWAHLDEEDTFLGFVDVTIEKLKEHKELFSRITPFDDKSNREKLEEIASDSNNRRKVWLKILTVLKDDDFWVLNSSRIINIRTEDLDWLVHEWKVTDDAKTKTRLFSQIEQFVLPYREMSPESLSAFIRVCEDNPELNEKFKNTFAMRVLPSEEAEREKEWYERYFGWQRKREEKKKEKENPVGPLPIERTLELVERFKSGDIEAWWQMKLVHDVIA